MTEITLEADPIELLRCHVETLFKLDGRGRMTGVNEREGGPPPRFFIGQTAAGNRWWFRDDLDNDLVAALEASSQEEAFVDDLARPSLRADRYARILGERAKVEDVSSGPAYCFPEHLDETSAVELIQEDRRDVLRRYCSEWLEDVGDCQPFAVLIRDGQAVSLCATVRRTKQAEQAGVETHPTLRGQGCAGEVVTTWGDAVRRLGRIPLYSTSWTNEGSKAVASKLGLVQL